MFGIFGASASLVRCTARCTTERVPPCMCAHMSMHHYYCYVVVASWIPAHRYVQLDLCDARWLGIGINVGCRQFSWSGACHIDYLVTFIAASSTLLALANWSATSLSELTAANVNCWAYKISQQRENLEFRVTKKSELSFTKDLSRFCDTWLSWDVCKQVSCKGNLAQRRSRIEATICVWAGLFQWPFIVFMSTTTMMARAQSSAQSRALRIAITRKFKANSLFLRGYVAVLIVSYQKHSLDHTFRFV